MLPRVVRLQGSSNATNAGTTAIENYEVLPAAKKKDIDALTASLVLKTQRIGELAVSIMQLKNDPTDSEEALLLVPLSQGAHFVHPATE